MRQTTKQTNMENQLYIMGACLLLVLPVVMILYRYLRAHVWFLSMPCLLHIFTGYYCPGCGGTRAVYALFHLRLWESVCYHPLVPYAAAVYLWFMISHTIEKLSRGRLRIGMKWNPCWLWAALVILVVNVLIKNGTLVLFHVDLL